jgi:UDP-N-acetylmuramyl pentapeptide phosphotransferase/UDP-N-acetylglucosamine-1-phosphate transferase
VFWFNIMPVRIMKGDTMELLVGAVVAAVTAVSARLVGFDTAATRIVP